MEHKSGFVSIIGKPNAGKSTLINLLVGEKLSIITSKAQTTRHRILGIVSTDDYQVVFSDTPGIIKPKYLLQESMMHAVEESLQDGDVVLYVTSWDERGSNEEIEKRLAKTKAPVICILNKIDLAASQEEVMNKTAELKEKYNPVMVIPVSAKENFNVQHIFPAILELLPEGPEYYPKDQFTDRPERFFASEIIREKIFMLLKEELPYSCEVDIMQFTEEEKIIRIHADIYVLRDSQKAIVIGKQGRTLKRIGIDARKDLEAFFGKQVYLETFVKVRDNWRDDKKYLKSFGYTD
jgi:GTP-binding protein Era